MPRPSAIIICPAVSQSNNGNWRTAERWRRMLAPIVRAAIGQQWNGEPHALMLALHVPYADYTADTRWVVWLLGPATVHSRYTSSSTGRSSDGTGCP